MVKIPPGNQEKMKENLTALFTVSLDKAQRAIEGVGTIHYARWILFDNGTRLLYTVVFDGDFDKYWADFLPWFTKEKIPPVFTLAEGFPKDALTNVESFKKFFRDHQVDSFAEYGAYDGANRQEIRRSLRVNKAFQQVLDNPAAAKALQDPALKPLLDLASE